MHNGRRGGRARPPSDWQATHLRLSEADLAEYARWFTQPGRAAAGFNLYRTMATVDVGHWQADRGRALGLPTLWIHGMKDRFVPPPGDQVLRRVFSNLRLERFEGCGHWVPEEEPDRTASALLDFLKEITSHPATGP